MVRNGLFMCSIGFLIILFTLNPVTMTYDLLSMTTGLFLVVVGGYIFFKGKKNEENKENQQQEVKK
jgi:predicted membrane protein